MKNKKTQKTGGRWTRRKALLSIPMVIGALALTGRIRLSYKGKISGRVGDHWEPIKDRK